MEDEAQKMVALKKAYADIILNTAKEAAARIMASERKAIRFQHDLCSSRDEALRMLLRLKQMLDSKTTEAELKSLSQQRRIDELEAQLQEAEDVITDLRAELKWKGDELENARRNQVQSKNEKATQKEASFPENFSPFPSSGCETMATSDAKNPRVMGDIKCCCTVKQTERLSASDTDGFDRGNSDLASIIMRSKKPELYRNGCTQRIRAFERNVVNGKLPHVNESFPMENEYITGALEKEVHNSSAIEMDKNSSQGEGKKTAKVSTFRRRKTQFGKAKTMRRCHQGQLLKSLHCKPRSRNRNYDSDEDERTLSAIEAANADLTQASDGSQETLQHDNKDEFKIFNKGKRKRNVKSGNDDGSSTSPSGQLGKHCQPSSVLSRCRTFAYLVNGGIKSVEDQSKTSENEAKVKPSPRLDPGSKLITKDSDSISVSSDVKAANKSETIQDGAEKDMELVQGSSAVVDDSRLSSSELNAEMTNASLLNCGLENIKASKRVNESPFNADNNRLLKYTFQRKRKREPTNSPDEIASPEKIPVTNNASESQKTSLIDESSRDSRRLAQVARQLISLSGRRWR